jgi:hypothetical protein
MLLAMLSFPMTGVGQQPAGTLNVKTDGRATGDGVTDDAAAIQAAIHDAKAQGKDLYFPPGTYVIGSDVTTTNGVSLYGDHAGISTIRSVPGTVHKIGNQTWSSPSSNVDVEDLFFLNSELDWYGSESVRKNINVRRCMFFANDSAFVTTTNGPQFQVSLGHVVDGMVEDCVFISQSNCTQECISGYRNVRQTYRRNVFGLHLGRAQWLETQWTGYSSWSNLTTKIQTLRTQFSLEDDQGWFRRALKINDSDGTLVEHNIFNGSPYTLSTPVNRDHVIYAHGGYTDLEVLSNWMRGWPSAPNGGLKIRNTHGTTAVIANCFVNTPILQYAYDNNNPQTYENAIIHRNHLDIYQNFSDNRLGISFWETVDGIPSQTNNEYSANTFECPKAYSNCINLTNGDLSGHAAYDSNVYLSDGSPVSTKHNTGPFPLVSGGPDPARYAAYDAYQIPMLDIPTYTSDPAFSTNLLDLGALHPDQVITGSVASLATDADGEPLEFMKMEGPDWLTVNLDGTYSGTPALSHAGLNEFTLRAADNKDGYGETTLRIHVHADFTTLSFAPVHDAHVSQENPDLNYGVKTRFAIRNDSGGKGFTGFMRFEADTAGLAVVSAQLKFYCSQRAVTLKLYEVADKNWTESTVTWNNQPTNISEFATMPVELDAWEEVDVTDQVASGGAVGFAFSSASLSYMNIWTKESTNAPVLEVTVASDSGDWDGDGLPNDWEQEFFGGETHAVAGADSDGDGYDNLAEFIAGSDPANAASVFSASLNPDPSGFIVTWHAVTGRTYRVWHCDVPGEGFSLLQDAIAFPENSFTDTLHQVESSGFYKVDVQLNQ